MAAIKLSEGSRVAIKGTERFGTVKSLVPTKVPGQRGRPKTYATVELEDGSGEGSYSIPDLKLV